MGHDVGSRYFDPEDYQVAARMGGLQKEKKMTKVNAGTFDIRGVKFRNKPEDLTYLEAKMPCKLLPEPTNEFDPNAIAILVGEHFLGYVPKELAKHFTPMIANGLKLSAMIKSTLPAKLIVTCWLVWDKE